MAAQEYLVDALNVHVYDTRDQMGQASANDAIRFLKEVLCHQATANVMFGAAAFPKRDVSRHAAL